MQGNSFAKRTRRLVARQMGGWNESCHTFECVMSPIRHVTNEKLEVWCMWSESSVMLSRFVYVVCVEGAFGV